MEAALKQTVANKEVLESAHKELFETSSLIKVRWYSVICITSIVVNTKASFLCIYISNPKQPSCKKSVRPSERLW